MPGKRLREISLGLYRWEDVLGRSVLWLDAPVADSVWIALWEPSPAAVVSKLIGIDFALTIF